MLINRYLPILGALGSIVPTIAFPNALPRPAPADASSTLKPINVRDFDSATGIRRRAVEDFSDLDLRTQSHLIYGRPGTQNQFILANMTLYAPDGLQMVMMERFEPLTSKVDCKGDDGTMSLTFKSKAAFNHALETWDFINESVEKKFVLIANHAGCGPDDERQPYIISKIREDVSALTTFLTARPAPWSEIAGTYDLDFGKALVTRSTQQRRGILGDIGDALEDVGQDVVDGVRHGAEAVTNGADDLVGAFAKLGDADLDKSVTFSVAVGQPNKVTNIVDQSFLKIDCVNCFVTGSFQVTGHLSVKGFKLQDLTLDASPQGIAATLELGTTITAKKDPESFQYTKELFSAPIPNAGIEVPGIFKLGAIVSYEVGISTTIAGSAAFQYGLTASLPDTAKVTADINTPDQSSATGFDSANVNPIFDVKALSASVTVAAFTQPKLFFGIELTEIGKFDVNINVKLPIVSATLTAAYNETGVCSQEPGASKTGVQLSSEIGIEVDLGVDATLGSHTAPTFSTKLAGISHPLFSHCFPLDIPGVSPVSGSSAASLPATVPLPTSTIIPTSLAQLTSVPTAVPIPSGTGSISVPLSTNPAGSPSGYLPGPTGTGGAAPSGTAPSYAPYPTYANGTAHAHYMRHLIRRGRAIM